jgi:hypothetical protein
MIFYDTIIIALILVLLLILLPFYNQLDSRANTTEGFDRYYDHDLGVYRAYNSGFGDFKPETVSDANLYARYGWSEKAKDGRDVYDHFYESQLRLDGTCGQDYAYVYRDLDGGKKDSSYDSKFSIDDGENNFYTYKIGDMYDFDPVRAYDFHSDEDAIISQKNY